MRIILAAALAIIAAPIALAQQPSGQTTTPRVVTHVETASDLAAVCDPAWTGVPRLEAIAYCQGFLTSAGQYHTLTHRPGGSTRPLYCPPTPAPSIAEAGLDFAAWMRANPARASEPALDGFLRWAQARFPCQPAR